MGSGRGTLRLARWAVGVALLAGIGIGCGGDDERETPAAPAAFGYSGSEGPANWATLDPAYAECSDGRRQSPVDLREGTPADLPRIEFSYRPAQVEVENNGHSLEAEYPAGSAIEIADTEYALQQFHFHAPSEHRFAGRGFPLEFHFVHATGDGSVAVLGVLVERGRVNPAFSPLTRTTPEKEGERLPVEGEIDALDLLPERPASARRWSYSGSLTTPPCTEGVRWEVFAEPIEMSAAQIRRYTVAYDSTNRPLQPLHGRRLSVSR